ncbi:hypothetical protein [Pseudonocardia xishanensis]|uniref:Uncharacterized protein n=1 Tax=Pseudonocardia xishanensis TaxID=630995 RepID=A0ABP8RZX2_9PSEU
MSEPQTHRVAVVVFVNAEGVDGLDAVNRAEQAVAVATDHTAGVVSVIELGRALRAGRLSVRPAVHGGEA